MVGIATTGHPRQSKSPVPNRGIKRKYDIEIDLPNPNILPARTRSQASKLLKDDEAKPKKVQVQDKKVTISPKMTKSREPTRPPSPISPQFKRRPETTGQRGQRQGRRTLSGRITRRSPPSPRITRFGSRSRSCGNGNAVSTPVPGGKGDAGAVVEQLSPQDRGLVTPPQLHRMDEGVQEEWILHRRINKNPEVKGQGRGRPGKEGGEEDKARSTTRPPGGGEGVSTNVGKVNQVTISTIGRGVNWRKSSPPPPLPWPLPIGDEFKRRPRLYDPDAPPFQTTYHICIPVVPLPRVTLGAGPGYQEVKLPSASNGFFGKRSPTGRGYGNGGVMRRPGLRGEIPFLNLRRFPSFPRPPRMNVEVITLDGPSDPWDGAAKGVMSRNDNHDSGENQLEGGARANTSSSSGLGNVYTSLAPPSSTNLNSGEQGSLPAYSFAQMFPSGVDFGHAFRCMQLLNTLLTQEPNSEVRVLAKDLMDVHQAISYAQRQSAFKVCDNNQGQGQG